MINSSVLAGEVVDLLIRSYGGLFEERVKIDESLIARRANIAEKTVREILRGMAGQMAVSYSERTGKPTLTYLEERLPIGNLNISKESYDDRKDTAQERHSAMIEFVSNNAICRSVQLLSYFGQEDPEACGLCDVCRGKHQNSNDPEKVEQHIKELKGKLDKGVSYHDLLSSEQSGSEDEYKAMRWVMDNAVNKTTKIKPAKPLRHGQN